MITSDEKFYAQRDELIEQYVELVVDSMDHKSLEQYVYEQMVTYVESLSDSEIKEEIDNHDEELYDELVDNVTNETVLDINNTGGKF